MKRICLAVAAAAIGLVGATATQAAVPKLVGTVGPGFTITLKKGGVNVRTLKAGTYSIAVSDLSNAHNFHLFGPGVNKTTTVAGKGRTTWTVKFQKGKTYRFICDPHASTMSGSFKVV
jgi:plastocyanin